MHTHGYEVTILAGFANGPIRHLVENLIPLFAGTIVARNSGLAVHGGMELKFMDASPQVAFRNVRPQRGEVRFGSWFAARILDCTESR